jgi:hypothetical protein
MMQDKTIRTLGSWFCGAAPRPEQIGMTLTAALGLVTLGFMAACAGSDTPETDASFRDQIAAQYGGGQGTGTGGSGTGVGGGSGVGGSSTTGSGGSATGAGGGAMAGTAGGGSTVGGTGGSSSAACDGFALLNLKCGGGNCHGAPSAGTLSNFAADATTAKAFAGQESSMCKATDNSAVFNPQSPANSLVIKKILDTTDCGGRMPLGSTMQALTDDEVDCLEDWISSLE